MNQKSISRYIIISSSKSRQKENLESSKKKRMSFPYKVATIRPLSNVSEETLQARKE
jgi:hypothetical protein